MSATFDNRPKAHYARDVRETVGQIVGPTLHGEYLVVAEVEWDGKRSTAFFRNATTADFQAAGGGLVLAGNRSRK